MKLVEALRDAPTPAAAYDLRLRAEALLTPLEVAALAARSAELPDETRAWIDGLQAALRQAAPAPLPFERRDHGKGVSHYAMPGRQAAGMARLLVFCGIGNRPDIATALFLQHLPAEGCDAVLLRDPSRLRFLCGIPGYAADPAELVARLAGDFAPPPPGRLACLGYSAGGTVALAVGQLLGAAVAVSVAGADPAQARRRRDKEGRTDGHEYARLLAASGAPAGRTRMFNVFGAAAPADRAKAAQVATLFPGSIAVPLRGVATHAVLHELARRNELRRFLAEALRGELEPAAWA